MKKALLMIMAVMMTAVCSQAVNWLSYPFLSPQTNDTFLLGSPSNGTNYQLSLLALEGMIGGNPNAVTNLQNGVTLSGTFSGNALGLTNIQSANSTEFKRWNVLSLGVTNNGAIANNCFIAAGSSNLFTYSPNQWTAADVGKNILVYGAGTNVAVPYDPGTSNIWCLSTTIYGFVNATNIVISTPAINPMGANSNVWNNSNFGQPAVYGTDQSANIMAALAYIATNNLTLKSGGGVAYFPEGIYPIAGPILDPYSSNVTWHVFSGVIASSANGHHNAQIYLPNIQSIGTRPIVLDIEGPVPPRDTLSFGPKMSSTGATLWDFYVPTNQTTVSGSMFDCQNFSTYVWGAQGTYLNPITIKFNNLTINGPTDPQLTYLDLRGSYNYDVRNMVIGTGYANGCTPSFLGGTNGNYPTCTNNFGLRGPLANAGGESFVDGLHLWGQYVGIEPGEHCNAGTIEAIHDYFAVMDFSGGHSCSIGTFDAESCFAAIGAADTAVGMVVLSLTGENDITPNSAYPNEYIQYDPQSSMAGTIGAIYFIGKWTNLVNSSGSKMLWPSTSVSQQPTYETVPAFRKGFLIGNYNRDNVPGSFNNTTTNSWYFGRFPDDPFDTKFEIESVYNGTRNDYEFYNGALYIYNGANQAGNIVGGYAGGGELPIYMTSGLNTSNAPIFAGNITASGSTYLNNFGNYADLVGKTNMLLIFSDSLLHTNTNYGSDILYQMLTNTAYGSTFTSFTVFTNFGVGGTTEAQIGLTQTNAGRYFNTNGDCGPGTNEFAILEGGANDIPTGDPWQTFLGQKWYNITNMAMTYPGCKIIVPVIPDSTQYWSVYTGSQLIESNRLFINQAIRDWANQGKIYLAWDMDKNANPSNAVVWSPIDGRHPNVACANQWGLDLANLLRSKNSLNSSIIDLPTPHYGTFLAGGIFGPDFRLVSNYGVVAGNQSQGALFDVVGNVLHIDDYDPTNASFSRTTVDVFNNATSASILQLGSTKQEVTLRWNNNGTVQNSLNSTNNSFFGHGLIVGTNALTGLVDSHSLFVQNSATAQMYIVNSNAWNLNFYTNGVANFATIFNASSNGFPVDIYMSNGTAMVYYQLGNGNQIIP
jgi:hypothetical protein